jgi:type IV pilus assembly protein PilB
MAVGASFSKGKGCTHCQRTGYRGRLGIFELMLMSSRIRELAFEGAPTQAIRKAAIAQGMTTLYSDGILKVLKGITTIEEVFRVAKKTEEH